MRAKRIERIRFEMFEQPKKSPASAGVPNVPAGFVACPAHVATANPWQQEVYRQAYERALQATQPPRHHRLFAFWN